MTIDGTPFTVTLPTVDRDADGHLVVARAWADAFTADRLAAGVAVPLIAAERETVIRYAATCPAEAGQVQHFRVRLVDR